MTTNKFWFQYATITASAYSDNEQLDIHNKHNIIAAAGKYNNSITNIRHYKIIINTLRNITNTIHIEYLRVVHNI